MKILKKILIILSILAVLTVTIFFLTLRNFTISEDELNTLSDKISKVKNKAELDKLINESKFGRIHIKSAFLRAFREKTNKNATIAIISFLSEPKIQNKYSIGEAMLSTLLAGIIKSPDYNLEMKEYAIKSFNIVPDNLQRLTDYFSEPENQETSLFNHYIQWCVNDLQDGEINDEVLDFIFITFDKIDEEEQMGILKKITGPVGQKDSKELKFLKKIAESEQYNEKLRELAKQRLGSLDQGE